MNQLHVESLAKRFGAHTVLSGVDLAVQSGGITALLGASGSGKTTLLRLIAGFERADSGRIAIGGEDVAGPGLHLPPERRRIGYVPQEGALFPHLTVAGNVGYGLDRAGRRSGRVEQVLRLTGLEALADRYPRQLSGGQQQRTALARALAPRPKLVLLDEPFNALDRELRATLCHEVTSAIRAAGATAVLVTHDPEEAFASADQVAVIHGGRVAQCAPPETVYRRPADLDVARLTGPVLLLDATLEEAGARTALGLIAGESGTGACRVMIRPEQVVLAAEGAPARIVSLAFRGDHTLVTAEVGGLQIPVRTDGIGLEPGAAIRLGVKGACVRVAGYKRQAASRAAASTISASGPQ
ncbi:MAG TPA: ABC transporter ATP-binding protein [Acetobacteraceae bacterium]|nr:ABC transporter ATP-binding protein [Acetobacteraceae bacterium]